LSLSIPGHFAHIAISSSRKTLSQRRWRLEDAFGTAALENNALWHYSPGMSRRAVLVTFLFASSCAKKPPPGDLPPAATPTAASTATPGVPETPPGPQPAPASASTGSPHGASAAQTPPRTLEALSGGRLAMGPFSLVAPPGWKVMPVTSNMRAAAFQLPGKPGDEPQLLVTYFGARGAGTVDDNVGRWVGQFTQPDGKPSREVTRIEKLQLAGQDAVIVSLSGHYVAQVMGPGGGAVDKQDQSLLAAIVASPSGPYYFKVVADKPTIAASTAAFRALLGSLELR
jgi:hypothetical protein